MTISHSIDEMKIVVYKNVRCRNEVLKSVIRDGKLTFPAPIVEYNQHMRGSNENAQQRAYYSSQRLDSRYWWPIFIFLLNAAVLNAYKIWGRLYPDSDLSHSNFQHQIIEALLSGGTRKRSSNLSIISPSKEDVEESASCEWKYAFKKSYCRACREKKVRLRKRSTLEEISGNPTKKRRPSQTNWQCKSCGLCCKKEECWRALPSNLNA